MDEKEIKKHEEKIEKLFEVTFKLITFYNKIIFKNVEDSKELLYITGRLSEDINRIAYLQERFLEKNNVELPESSTEKCLKVKYC